MLDMPPVSIDGSPHHELIERLTNLHSEEDSDAAIDLWRKLAAQVIMIVGETGFNSLYERSLFLTQSAFPWIEPNLPSPNTDHGVANLKLCFEKQARLQASGANRMLLINFTDILASLIGEQLTSSILRSAWREDASDRASKGPYSE